MNVRGSVDVVTTKNVVGWLFASEAKSPIAVEAHINHQVIGAALADGPRPDLAAVGLGDGRCGFSIQFDHPVDSRYLPFIVVRPAGSDLELPRTTLSGYQDFFDAYFSRYPVTARARSLIGGLWTDRLDAGAVLRSRKAAGLLQPAAEPHLQALIVDGHVVLDTEEAPARREAGDSATDDNVAKLFFADRVLNVLRGVFEDNPLALPYETITGSKFYQGSGIAETPSPAECLVLIAAMDDGVTLEILRQSHLLPEFTADGYSRWTSRGELPTEIAERLSGSVEQVTIAPGTLALLSPGLIHRVKCLSGTSALRLLAVPNRLAPFSLTQNDKTREWKHGSGARMLFSSR